MIRLFGTPAGGERQKMTVSGLNGTPAPLPESSPPAGADGESDHIKGLRVVANRRAEPDGSGEAGATRAETAEPFLPAAPPEEFQDWNIDRVRICRTRLEAVSAVLADDPNLGHAAEQYRMVRTKIAQLLHRPFRVIVTSAGIGDGKTLSALNLAAALAMKSDGRTLLLDADLRRSSVYQCLGVPGGPGLADVLAGASRLEESIIQVSEQPHLYVLPAGEAAGSPSELLDSARWHALTVALLRSFSHVVMDTPPVDAVADYDLIAAACDGVVLVVRPDHTDRAHCLAAVARVRPKLVGVLINDAREWPFSKQVGGHDYYYRKHGKSA